MVQQVGVNYKVTGMQQLQTLKVRLEGYNKLLAQVRANTSQLAQANAQLVSTTMAQQQQFQQLNQSVSTYGTANVQLLDSLYQQADAIRTQNDAMVQQLGIIAQNTEQQNTNTQSTQQNTTARNRNTSATRNSTTAWLKNLRTLALWTAGSASVFLIIRKIRAAFVDTISTLLEHSKEYENLQRAQENFRAALVAALGSQESWRQALQSTAEVVEWFSDAILEAAATFRGFVAMVETAAGDAGALGQLAFAFSSLARGNIPGFIEQLKLAARTNTDVAQAFIDARNESLSAGRSMQKAFRAANEEVSNAKKGVNELDKALQNQIKTLEKLIDAEKRRIEATLDLLEEVRQREQDLATDRARALEDLAIDAARTREDIEIKYQRRLEDIRDDAADQRARAEERYRIRLLQIELRYRERLIRIEEDFQDSISDAIRTRNATAALQAIRRRTRDQGRAKRERDDDRAIAQANYEAQLNDQQRALERQRRDAALERQRALEDLRRDLEREREDIATNQRREMDDLNLFFQRRLQEIDDDYQRQLLEAQEFYTEDKTEYRNYLQGKLNALIAYYNEVVRVAAAIRAVQAGITVPTYTGGGSDGGHPRKRFAQGGIGYYSSPTTIQVAEARPEIVVAIPLQPSPSQSMGRLNATVGGSVEGVMPGFEGRFSALMTEAAIRAMGELIPQ